MISANALSKTFHSKTGTSTPVDNVTASFSDGGISYLLGLNGTGKSTLLRMLCGVLTPDSGHVKTDGRGVGMMLNTEAAHPDHTGLRHMRWVSAARGLGAAESIEMLNIVGLQSVMNRQVKHYSLGMRQRLGIATAILGYPRTIVLDEPFNGLDIAGVLWLRRLLADLAAAGHCIIIASHHVAEVAASAHHISILERGSIVASGALTEICEKHETLEDAFIRLVPRCLSQEVSP